MLLQIVTLLLLLERARSASVLVIGAGPSGIAAATRLLDAGFNVSVIEAEERIGGRILSVWLGEGYVDLGAQFVHGEKGNVVYEMIEGLDLVQTTNFTFDLYTSDGRIVDRELCNRLLGFMGEILGAANEQGESAVMEDYFRQRYLELVTSTFANDTEDLEIALSATETLTHAILSIQPRQEESAKQNMTILPGDSNLNWKTYGYKTILEILLDGRTDFRPQLGVRARKIRWNQSDGQVTVYCNGGKVFEADHVVYTGSLGVLKAEHGKLFSPKLDRKKVEAIRSMGYGVAMKGMMEFKERWWVGALPAMFIWKDRKSWITDLTWAIELPDNSNVLMLWITGENIPHIEKLSDAEFTEQIMQSLRTFFGAKYNVTEPVKTLRSSWWSNENYRGSYSFETVESRRQGNGHLILAEPLVQNGVAKVLFAGEATHPIYYASVHGAIETGYAVADKLINMY